jgi:SAM-dependent methyltransferase
MITVLRSLKHRLDARRRESRLREQFDEFAASARTKGQRFEMEWEARMLCYGDDTPNTGFDRHYVYHPAWAARIVREISPDKHVDISSTLYFCSMLSAFIPVDFYDYRPANLELNGLRSQPGDLMALPFADNSLPSLSCMHTVEHIGLGRYGDPMDPDGDLKAIAELKRVVAPGGSLLFVTPTGRPRIVYNAHRIYSYDQVVEAFSGFELREFALVPDKEEDGGLIRNAAPTMANAQSYGCGCYWFVKRGPL